MPSYFHELCANFRHSLPDAFSKNAFTDAVAVVNGCTVTHSRRQIYAPNKQFTYSSDGGETLLTFDELIRLGARTDDTDNQGEDDNDDDIQPPDRSSTKATYTKPHNY